MCDNGIPEKRAKEFIRHCIDLFECSAKLSCAIYFDKNVSKCHISKSVGVGVGAVVGLALSYCIPAGGKLIGKGSGKVIAYVGKHIEKTIDSRKQEKIATLLEGFDLADSKWKTTLVNAFFDIFLNYNIQMVFLLCELSNITPDKCMWKLAKDTVLRIFNDLETTTEEVLVLDKDQIVKSFLRGKSGEGFMCDLLHQMGLSEPGKTIKVKDMAKEYKTNNLFEKPDILFDSQVLMKEGSPGKYMYRRSFPFESLEQFKHKIEWKMSVIHDLLDYQEQCKRERKNQEGESIYDKYCLLTQKRKKILFKLCSETEQYQIETTGIREKLKEVANGLEKVGIEKEDTCNIIMKDMKEVQDVQKLQELFLQEINASVSVMKEDVEELKLDVEELQGYKEELKILREYREYLPLLKILISKGELSGLVKETEMETRGKGTDHDIDYDSVKEYFDPADWLPKLAALVTNNTLNMPAVPSISRSVCCLKRDAETKGTIFWVKMSEIEGVFLFSSGQNFETDGAFVDLDMRQFTIHPSNNSYKHPGMNIQEDLLNNTRHLLLLGYEGQICLKQSSGFTGYVKEEYHEDALQQDFFLLYLPDFHDTDELEFLALDGVFTSKVQDIKENAPGEFVSMFGYTEPIDNETSDICLSFGKVENTRSDAGNIIFHAFTLEPSCGAPVFGENGKLSGIFLERFDEAEDMDKNYTFQGLGTVLEEIKLFIPGYSS